VKNVLVTGCAGLIGSHLSTHLLNNGFSVVGIDDLSGGYEDWLPKHQNFRFHRQNLVHTGDLDNVFRDTRFDAVIHLAAYAAEGLSPFIRVHNYQNNVIASANVINKCIEHECKLIFTSSMAVYGDQATPFVETQPCKPVDPYGNAKAAVENDLKMASDQFGLRYSIIRPHNVIGTNQNIWDRYRNVLGIFIRRTIAGQPMQVYGDGEQKRAFSDIQFFLPVFQKLIDDFDREIFNIGSDNYLTINQLAEIVAQQSIVFGLKPRIEHMEPRIEVANAFCNHDKAKTLLGFHDQTSIEETTRTMIQWAMTQPERTIKNMNYEITKGIYSYWA